MFRCYGYMSTLLFEYQGEDFWLPIDHKPTENIDLDSVEQASLDTQLTSTNIGFRLLQKMGWKGKGPGREEQGVYIYISLSYIWQGNSLFNSINNSFHALTR